MATETDEDFALTRYLSENGVVISEPTDMQSFVSAVQCVYDTYLPELSPELQEIVQEIVAMGTKG